MNGLAGAMGCGAPQARRWLTRLQWSGLANVEKGFLDLTEPGAFWVHFAQNHFALQYVNKLWTTARQAPWPERIPF